MRYGEFFAPSYLAVGEHNIFSINWGQLEGLNYLKAAATTEPVGKHSALLVLLLAFEAGAKMEEIHLVGHSLGAHVVGFLGKEVQVLGLGKVTIIIIITRPKPPSGRQGLVGSWGKDTVRQVHYKMFSTSHFAPTALSSNWILLLNVVIKTHL